MNAWNLIMLVLMYPLLPIMYFQMRNEAKPKKNIVLGVTLPLETLSAPEVEAICEAYKKKLRVSLWVCLVLPLSCLLFDRISIGMSVLMLWMLLVIGWMIAIYIGGNRRMREYKLGLSLPGPEADGGKDSIQVDLHAVARGSAEINAAWYILPLLVGIVPVVLLLLFERGRAGFGWILFTCLTMFAVVLLFPLMDRVLRRRSDLANADSELNAALTRMRRAYWGRCCMQYASLTALFNILLYLMLIERISLVAGLIACCVYTLLALASAMYAEFGCRHAQERMAGQIRDAVDTDENWPLGMFYYNRADKRTLVHSRTGVGSTFNMAHFWGKFIMGFAALCILIIPVTCGWLIAEDFTPIRARIVDGSLIVEHLGVCYSVDVDAIAEAALIDTLPSGSKIAGTGMDAVLKGSFNLRDYGACKLYLNPKEGPFITFLAEGERVFVNAAGLETLLE